MATYRTRTYIAGDWDNDKDAVDQLHKWNDSNYWNLSFRTPQQSRRNTKHLPRIGVYRHYGGSPQSALYRQAEGQPHNEGAYP